MLGGSVAERRCKSVAVVSRVVWKKRNGAFFRWRKSIHQRTADQGGQWRNAPWSRVEGPRVSLSRHPRPARPQRGQLLALEL